MNLRHLRARRQHLTRERIAKKSRYGFERITDIPRGGRTKMFDGQVAQWSGFRFLEGCPAPFTPAQTKVMMDWYGAHIGIDQGAAPDATVAMRVESDAEGNISFTPIQRRDFYLD